MGSVDAYVAQPFGRYWAGKACLHFTFEPALCGTVFWGRPEADDIVALTHAIAVELPEHTPRHSAFVDTTRLTSVDPEAFVALAAYVGPRATPFASNIVRQAIVRPPGVIGALVTGFYDVTPSAAPERTRLCDEPSQALSWLGRTDGAALLDAIGEAYAEASGAPSHVQALHAYVLARPRRVVLAEAARALSLSPRTLEESLRRSGTTFRKEVNLARVRAAQSLLAGSDTKLSVVALEVGCASLQHFSSMFRRVTGIAPSVFRAARRGDGPGSESRSGSRSSGSGTSR